VENCIVVDGGTFTLDLNGHTISSESHTLDIQNESNVTIVDNSGTNEGKVITLGAGCFSVGVSAGASVTISDGIYESTYYSALDVSTTVLRQLMAEHLRLQIMTPYTIREILKL
jgi:hypothetical protein